MSKSMQTKDKLANNLLKISHMLAALSPDVFRKLSYGSLSGRSSILGQLERKGKEITYADI